MNETCMKTTIIHWFAIFGLGLTALAQSKALYENNFEKVEVGTVPQDFLVLDGGFLVKEENGNKFLELPGAPLDSFAVQFGPAEADNVDVLARRKAADREQRKPNLDSSNNGVLRHNMKK